MGGRKVFTRERLLASEVNDLLMDQTVMAFATAAARNSAIPTPEEGMVSYTADSKRYWWADAAGVWQYLGGRAPAVTALPLTGFATFGGRTPGYRIDGSGFVNLEGAMTNSNPFTPPSLTICTLPVGARPPTAREFACATNAFTGRAHDLFVGTDGAVSILGPTTAVAAGAVWSLDGARFPAA